MPEFRVTFPEYEEGWTVSAADPESAAIEAVTRHESNSACYDVAAGKETIEAEVYGPTGAVFRFVVSGEPVPYYRARPVRGEN